MISPDDDRIDQIEQTRMEVKRDAKHGMIILFIFLASVTALAYLFKG